MTYNIKTPRVSDAPRTRGRVTRKGWRGVVCTNPDPIEQARHAFACENNAKYHRETDALAYLRSDEDENDDVEYSIRPEDAPLRFAYHASVAEHDRKVRETDATLVGAVGAAADRWRDVVLPRSRGARRSFETLAKLVERERAAAKL